jgi:hypothetical protein
LDVIYSLARSWPEANEVRGNGDRQVDVEAALESAEPKEKKIKRPAPIVAVPLR